MPDKDEVARTLADAHRNLEETIARIVRLRGRREQDQNEPIKLLEVNSATSPSGIWPIAFGPAEDVPYGSVVVEVTPAEYDAIIAGQLDLPDGWELGETLYAKAS
jgi:hypothetical protein